MADTIIITNISQQIGALGAGLQTGVKDAWDAGWGDMMEDMGEVLEGRIQQDVFGKQAEPSGKAWKAMAPATADLYRAQSKPTRLGGNAMRRSFLRGARGNFWRSTKQGFSLGSMLKTPRGHVVARTYQEDFYTPRSESDVEKAQAIRQYFAGWIGRPIPGKGKRLHHPRRRLVYWTRDWEKALSRVAEDHLTRAVQAGMRKGKRDVAALQGVYDRARR